MGDSAAAQAVRIPARVPFDFSTLDLSSHQVVLAHSCTQDGEARFGTLSISEITTSKGNIIEIEGRPCWHCTICNFTVLPPEYGDAQAEAVNAAEEEYLARNN